MYIEGICQEVRGFCCYLRIIGGFVLYKYEFNGVFSYVKVLQFYNIYKIYKYCVR